MDSKQLQENQAPRVYEEKNSQEEQKVQLENMERQESQVLFKTMPHANAQLPAHESPLLKVQPTEEVADVSAFREKGMYARIDQERSPEVIQIGAVKSGVEDAMLKASVRSGVQGIVANTIQEFANASAQREHLKEQERTRRQRNQMRAYAEAGASQKLREKKNEQITDQMLRFSKSFAAWKKAMDKDSVLCRQLKDIRLLRMVHAYQSVIDVYDGIREVGTEAQSIAEFYVEYQELQRSRAEITDPMNEKNERYTPAQREEYIAYQQRNERLESRTGLKTYTEEGIQEAGESISQVQEDAVMAIDQWIVRNAKNANIAFVDRVLSLSAKERLLVYYAVQCSTNYMLKKGEIAIAKQFTPSLDAFKSKMVASKFYFWRRFSGSQYYWVKLEHAVFSVTGMRDEIQRQAREEESQAALDATEEEIRTLYSIENPSEDEQKALELKTQQLHQMTLGNTLAGLLKEQQTLLQEKEKGADVGEKLAENAAQISETFGGMRDSAGKMRVLLGEEPPAMTGAQKAGFIEGTLGGVSGLAAISDGSALVSLSGKITDTFGKMERAKASEAAALWGHLEKTYASFQDAMKANAVITSMAAIGSMAGVVAGVLHMTIEYAHLTALDKIDATLGIIGRAQAAAASVASTITSIVTAGKSLQDFATSVATGTKTTLEAGAGNATYVLGWIGAGVETTVAVSKGVRAAIRGKDIKRAIAGFRDAKPEFDAQNTDTMEERMVRLAQRNNRALKKEAVGAAIGAAITTGVVIVTGGLSLLGILLVGIGSIALSASIKGALTTDVIDDAIDDFLGTEEYLAESDARKLSAYAAGSPEYAACETQLGKTKKERRIALRNELIGTLGFSGREGLFAQAMRMQGEQIYHKLFLDAETGDYIGKHPEKMEAHRRQVEPYVQLVQGFGCKVAFGESLEECKPTLERLVRKLGRG